MFRKQAKEVIAKLSSNNYQTLNIITLSQDNLLNNVKAIKDQHAGFAIIPVLKANAYGHGIEQIASMLNKSECQYLAVDGYFEAARIRDISRHKILVLGYIKPENARLLDLKRCSFVVQDIEGLTSLGSLKKPVNIHMEINTGMNRLGLQPDEINSYLKVLKSFPNLKLEGIMTHLADADNPNNSEYTKNQAELFDRLVEDTIQAGFSPRYIHIAQTAGSTKVKSKHANTIRLGIGLYGINPLSETDTHFSDLNKLKPVLELSSTIIKTISLNKGDRVSYNGIFTAPAEMRIGVLPLGYYEAIPRELSNKGMITLRGTQLPITGRVCMNHTMVNLGSSEAKVGDEVVVFSRDSLRPNSISQICKSNKMFSYSLLTGLSSSIRRRVT